MYTQDEYNITKQLNRKLYAKIELLNYKFQTVDDLTGVVIGFPSFNENADSDLRRSCNISLIPTDTSFDISEGNKIWLDKYIKVWIGIENIHTKEIIYTKKGIYLINNPNRVYSSENNTLTFSGLDLMARLTGLRNGELEGIPYIIPQGSNVRKVMIGLLAMAGFNKYSIIECEIDTPNVIRTDSGGTIYGLLKMLRDILPYYQIYFDEDGVFHYERIPFGHNEQVMITDDIWKNVLIDYNIQTDFENVKNYIEVYGKTHNIKNYSTNTTINDNIIITNINSINKMRNNLKIGFTTPNIFNFNSNPSLKIIGENDIDLGTYVLKYGNGNLLKKEDIKPNTYYVAKMIFGDNYYIIEKTNEESTNIATLNTSINQYILSANVQADPNDNSTPINNATFTFKTPNINCEKAYNPTLKLNSFDNIEIKDVLYLENDTNYKVTFIKNSNDESKKYFYFMGEVTPKAKAYDDNQNSPFYINGTVGIIRKVLRGGEYDNIYTTELAQLRANWELYKRCRLQDSITITCVPIYWIKTNWLVEITLPNKYGEEKTEKYIINSISENGGVNGVQTINMIKYYPSKNN